MVLLTHGGEADSDGRCLADMFKQFGLAIAGDVMSHLKVAKRSWIMKETIISQFASPVHASANIQNLCGPAS